MASETYRAQTPTLRAVRTPFERTLTVACPMCDGHDHFHVEGSDCFDGVYAPQCIDGPGSPYAKTGYRLDIHDVASLRDDVDVYAPFAARPLWWHLQKDAARLQATTAAIFLQRGRTQTVFEGRLRGGPASAFSLVGASWRYGPYRGDDLATAAAKLYRTLPGIVAVRTAEAALGLRLDAQAFLEAQAAFEGFYQRGAKRGEGRRA